MPAVHPSLLDSPLLEPVLLRGASRRAQALSDAARARMKPWLRASEAHFRVALELRARESQSVALGLLQRAAFFALCALEAAESAEPPAAGSVKAAWERFSALPAREGAPVLLKRVRDALGTDDLLALASLDPETATELRPAAEETVAWLLGLVEVRSSRELKRARWVRSVLLGAASIAIVWALLSYWFALSALSGQAH